MIYLLFSIGADRYALEATRIVEILPCVRLKRIPQTPPGVAGVLNYYGATVPVIDLSGMTLGVPAKESLSTRLAVVRYTLPRGDLEQLLGVMLEKATETVRLKPTDFTDSGISSHSGPTPYLGPVASLKRPDGSIDMVQLVQVEHLLTPEVRDRLWNDADAVVSSEASISSSQL